MATTVELATGYVTLAVDASKVGAQVGKAFSGAERQGTEAGQKIGQSMAKAFDRTKPDMSKLGADVERAEQRATTAVERNAVKQENSKRKVDIAQAKLTETVEKYGDKSSQALIAQDRLSTAQQKHEAAAMGARQEQEKLNRELADAKEAFSKAEKAASDAANRSDAASEKYARGWRGVGQKIRGFLVGGVGDATDAADREAGDSDGADNYARGWRGVGEKLRGDLKRGVKSATNDAEDQAERGGREAGSGFKDAFKGAVAGLAAYAGLQEIGGQLWSGVQGAGDLEQSVGAISTVFGDSSGQMLQWSNDAAAAVGLSKNEFNELGTLMGSQLKNGGTAMDELAPKTNELITLGSDLSSMFGGDTTTAVEALSSALKGERDPIEKYGVSLNQAKIDAQAAAMGFEKVDGALSSEANQAATLALIMEQTADAHGNFSRESDTFAHKQQVMAAQWENVKAKMGDLFLPVLTKVFGFIGEKAIPAITEFVGGIRAFAYAWIENTGDITSSGFAGWMEGLANNLRNAYDWLAKYAPIWGPFAIGVGVVATAYAIWAGASWAAAAANSALAAAVAAVSWPVLAVLAAVGLLIGGLIMAYRRIGWFKAAVNAAWAGIKVAAAATVAWFVGTAWPVIQSVLKWVGAAFVWLWQNAAVPAWNWVKAAALGFITWFTATAWPAIQGAVQAIGGFFVWLWQSVVVPAWGAIRGAVLGFVSWFATVAWPAIQTAVQVMGQIFLWLWRNVLQPAWTGIRIAVAIAAGIVLTIFQGIVWVVRNVLAPIFTWLYEHVVKPVFAWIVNAAKAWWSGLQVYFNLVKWIIQNVVGPVVGWLWRNVFKPNFEAIGSAVKFAWEKVIKPAFDALKQGATWVGDRAAQLRDRWQLIWAFIRSNSRAAWNYIRDHVFEPIKQGASWVGDRFSAVRDRLREIWRNVRTFLFDGFVAIRDRTFGPLKQGASWVADRFGSVRDRIRQIWQDLRQKLFDGMNAIKERTFTPLKDGVDRVKDAFSTAVDGIKEVWQKLEEATKAPVRFFVNTVYNDGLRANVNKVLDKVGLKDKHLPELKLPGGFARGGVIPGYEPRRRDDRLIPMRSGEGVLVPEVVRGIGADAVHALNSAGNSGGVGAVRSAWSSMTAPGSPDPDRADPHAAGAGTIHFGGQASFASANLTEVDKNGRLYIRNSGVSSRWGLGGAAKMWDDLGIIDVELNNRGKSPSTDAVSGSWARPWGGYWAASGAPNADRIWLNDAGVRGLDNTDLQVITAHEIGHALGLRHAHRGRGEAGDGTRSIMNYDTMRQDDRITSGDVAALKKIYPQFVNAQSAKGGGGSASGADEAGLLSIIMRPIRGVIDGIADKVGGAFPGNFSSDIAIGAGKNVLGEGIFSWAGNLVKNTKSFIDDLFDGGGDGEPSGKGTMSRSAVAEVATRALQMKGLFSSANLAAMVTQAQYESGFNPDAIQTVRDVNWPNNKARGLWQVTPGTFKGNQEPGYGDIFETLDNGLAAINTVVRSWGSITSRWPTKGGYALGGVVDHKLFDGGGQLHEGFTLMEHRRPKPDKVLTDEQWRVMASIAVDGSQAGPDMGRAIELLEQIANADHDVVVKVGDKVVFEAYEAHKRRTRIR